MGDALGNQDNERLHKVLTEPLAGPRQEDYRHQAGAGHSHACHEQHLGWRYHAHGGSRMDHAGRQDEERRSLNAVLQLDAEKGPAILSLLVLHHVRPTN